MQKIDIGRAVQTTANVGVIVGILILVVEINQNTAAIYAQTSQSRADAALTEAESLYNSEFLPEIFVAIQHKQPLTEVQTFRYQEWLRAFHRIQDNFLQQHRQGLLGDEILRSARQGIAMTFAEDEIARQNWAATKGAYSDDYIAFVDAIFREYSSENTVD